VLGVALGGAGLYTNVDGTRQDMAGHADFVEKGITKHTEIIKTDILGHTTNIKKDITQNGDVVKNDILEHTDSIEMDIKRLINTAREDTKTQLNRITRQIDAAIKRKEDAIKTHIHTVKSELVNLIEKSRQHTFKMSVSEFKSKLQSGKFVFSEHSEYIPQWGTYIRGCVLFGRDGDVGIYLLHYTDRDTTGWSTSPTHTTFDLTVRCVQPPRGVLRDVTGGEFDSTNGGWLIIERSSQTKLREAGCVKGDTLTVEFVVSV